MANKPVVSYKQLLDHLPYFRVEPGTKVSLDKNAPKHWRPGWAGDDKFDKAKRKSAAQSILADSVAALVESQDRLFADDSWSVLIVLQARDAAGKDSTIKHVMSGLNPQGCQVTSFKQPSHLELDHNFLWRCNSALPSRGCFGIFNRSYYEEVLIVRVHPELLLSQRIPDLKLGKKLWEERYDDINNFERHLARNGTLILKFFLNVSMEEQKQRFLDRIDDETKQWKYSTADMNERKYWDDYTQAYEQAIEATSTKWAPWHIVPADHKWVTRAVVAATISSSIKQLKLKYPRLDKEAQQNLAQQKKQLLKE